MGKTTKKNEKIKEKRQTVWNEGIYKIIKIFVEDGQEAYFFPQVKKRETMMKEFVWEYIHCNVYCNLQGVQNIYTTEDLSVNWYSSHKYSFIGCHSYEFSLELIKCHKMGIDKYMAMKANTKVEWIIRHPGTGEKITCESFEECMEKWFEGFNLPFLYTGGERENFKTANKRVVKYIKDN